MSAESVEVITESGLMDGEPLPDWVIPPPGGFTVDDFLRMHGLLPRHTELIDGSLVFVSPQTMWHSQVLKLLENELDRQAPEHLRAVREMTVKLGERQAPEPDIAVVTAEAFSRGDSRTHFLAAEAVLVIEVVSAESVERDREIKPRRYLAAGIRHFWRVEKDEDRTAVYVYEYEPATAAYALTGIHHDQLKVTAPFDIEIDLTALGKRR